MRRARDDTVAIARQFTDRVVVRAVARLRRAEELRGLAREPRLDSLARRRRAGDAGARRRDQDAAGGRARRRGVPDPARHVASRPLDSHDRLVSRTISCGSTIGGAAEWTGRYVHEAIDRATAPSAGCVASCSTSRIATSPIISRPSTATRRTRRGRCTRSGRRAGLLQIAGHPPLAFLRNYLAARRLPRRRAGPDHLGDERVLRVPEVREALGAATGPELRVRGSELELDEP